MTFFRAFLYQTILFLVSYAVHWYRRDKYSPGSFGREAYGFSLSPWFYVYLIAIGWFGIMTYVRMHFDWPLLGLYYYILPPAGDLTVRENWKHGLLGLSALGIILFKISFYFKDSTQKNNHR